jgi:hypothetical protein
MHDEEIVRTATAQVQRQRLALLRLVFVADFSRREEDGSYPKYLELSHVTLHKWLPHRDQRVFHKVNSFQ